MRSIFPAPSSIAPRSARSGGRTRVSEPDGSWQTVLQTPHHHRCRGHPTGDDHHRHQSPRRDAVAATGGSDFAHRGKTRAAASSSGFGPGGQGLQLASSQNAAVDSTYRTGSPVARHAASQRALRASLGGRADAELAAPVPTSSRSVRSSSRYPSGVPHDRMYPHLLENAE